MLRSNDKIKPTDSIVRSNCFRLSWERVQGFGQPFSSSAFLTPLNKKINLAHDTTEPKVNCMRRGQKPQREGVVREPFIYVLAEFVR